jgi:hypothetical protein
LDIITDSKYKPIATSAAALRAIMFSSLLASPIATIRWAAEKQAHDKVVTQTKSELELESDKAIDLALPQQTNDVGQKSVSVEKVECGFM